MPGPTTLQVGVFQGFEVIIALVILFAIGALIISRLDTGRLTDRDEEVFTINLLPRNPKVRREFADEQLRDEDIHEDVTLKYKDPEDTKLHIRQEMRDMGYAILHGELDHTTIQFGKEPMFKDVDSKPYVLSFKLEKPLNTPRTLGLGLAIGGLGVALLSLAVGLNVLLQPDIGWVGGLYVYGNLSAALPYLIPVIGGLVLVPVGRWIARSLTLWIKGVGIAHRVKGTDIYSDQFFRFAASCGFDGLEKMSTLRKDFDRIFNDIIQYLGREEQQVTVSD